MSCASGCIKYLLFIFNFLFTLGGLAILVCGILLQISTSDFKELTPDITSVPIIVLIIVGAVIFIIAFFGCCGAIRESHCMIISFAVLLLTLLVIQVAVAAFAFVQFKEDGGKAQIDNLIKDMVDKYFKDDDKIKTAINTVQSFAHCCGYNSYNDYLRNPDNQNQIIPYSCCARAEGKECPVQDIKYQDGCRDKVYVMYKNFSNGLAGLAIGIAVVELIGIIFSFCLANSIRNVQRRGYKV